MRPGEEEEEEGGTFLLEDEGGKKVIVYNGKRFSVKYYVDFDPSTGKGVVVAKDLEATNTDTTYGKAGISSKSLLSILQKDIVKQLIEPRDRPAFLSILRRALDEIASSAAAAPPAASAGGDDMLLYLYKRFYVDVPHPLLYVQYALSKKVCGMYRERLLLFLSLFTIHAANKVFRPVEEYDVEDMKAESYFPPNVLVLGESGSGKTHMIDAVWELFPEFDMGEARGVLVLDDIKPSYLRYLAGAGEERGFELVLFVDGMTIVIRDWEKLKKSNPELRLVVEERGQLKVATTIKTSKNEFKPKIYVLRGSINLVVASTEAAVEEQTADRSIIITVTLVDKSTLKNYYKVMGDLRNRNPFLYDALKSAVEDTEMLVRNFPALYSRYAVENGFDPKYIDVYTTWVFDVFPPRLASPRFMKQVITLARALAILNFPNRTVLEDAQGRRMIAVHPEDVMLVLDLLSDILVEKLSGLNKRLSMILEAVRRALDSGGVEAEELEELCPGSAAAGRAVTLDDIIRAYGELVGQIKSPRWMRERLRELEIRGYVVSCEGKRRKKYYSIREEAGAETTSRELLERIAERVREVAENWEQTIERYADASNLSVVEVKPSTYVCPVPGKSLFSPDAQFTDPLMELIEREEGEER